MQETNSVEQQIAVEVVERPYDTTVSYPITAETGKKSLWGVGKAVNPTPQKQGN
jgi:hypothetical protein